MDFFKKNKLYILSFILPVLILLVAFTVANKLPFGKYITMIYDGSLQYPGFASYFINVLKGSESILYSFKGALGFNFYANAVYYLFNPSSLLLIFFRNTNIQYFYLMQTFLQVGLCGLTSSILLNYMSPKNKNNLLFALAYSLLSFTLSNYYNSMWFDSVYMLPLVILGLEKLIKENKICMYIIFLTLSIISNFYMGYMICIFCLLYFIYKFILLDKIKRKVKLIKTFVVSSLLAGLMTAFALIPVAIELYQGKVSMYNHPSYTNYFEFDSDGIAAFYKLVPGSFNVQGISYGSPNIYCTLFVVVLVLLYFLNKNIKTKDKIVTGVFLAFFMFGFSFNLFDYGWQLFQRPIWYQTRYAYIFDLLLILIAQKSLANIPGNKFNFVQLICIIFSFFLFVVAGSFVEGIFADGIISSRTIFLVLSLFLIVQYAFVFTGNGLMPFAICLFSIELVSNTMYNIKVLPNYKENTYYTEKTTEELEYVNKIKSVEESNTFYRFDTKNMLVINSGLYNNYNSYNYFSSLRNHHAIDILNMFEFKVIDGCSVRFNASNPITNALFATKYIISSEDEYYYEYVPRVTLSDENIYYNKDALSLGYMVNDEVAKLKLNDKDELGNTNLIVKALLGLDEDIYVDVEGSDSVLNMVDSGNYYSLIDTSENGEITVNYVVSENGFYFPNNIGNSRTISVSLNNNVFSGDNITAIYANEGDSLSISYSVTTSTSKPSLKVKFLSYELYSKFIDKLKGNQFKLTNFESDSHFMGKIITEEDTVMMTTIPYDKGWTIVVDGEKYEYDKLFGGLISLNLSKGEHTIEFSYFPRGLKVGLIISFVSFVLTLFYSHMHYKRNH